eukprot:1944611-Pyramimonas_sp.AAC.1
MTKCSPRPLRGAVDNSGAGGAQSRRAGGFRIAITPALAAGVGWGVGWGCSVGVDAELGLKHPRKVVSEVHSP